jgi:tight adherence protein C
MGAAGAILGTIAPSFWLDYVKTSRQTKIRRALPDALDVLVVCLEGGLSLSGAFSRVARELATAHPMLSVEFQIIERQTRMGRTVGQAVREMADRFELEELRSMSSVIIQAEKIGSSVVTALEVFADTMRQKRHQRAEEMAQKAVVKIIFPTLLFIFPGIFVVILGPAAIQIYQLLIKGGLLNHMR